MMTITIMSYDRRRFLFDPRKGNVPVRWAIGLTWAISFGLVLPYIGYIVFIDLSVLGPEFEGGQICIISLPGKASTYTKVLFVFFYAIPMLTSVAFLRRTSKLIRQRELEQTGYRNGGITNDEYSEYYRYSEPCYWNNGYLSNDNRNLSRQHPRREHHHQSDSFCLFDVQKEKRSQKFLYLIIITYFICLFPLNILKLVRQLVMETYDNAGDFDVTYTIIVWVAFLPTVFVPWYFAQWIFLGDDISKDTFRFYLSSKTDSPVSFPGLSEPLWDNTCRPTPPQRTPTPPPPPGYSYPKKSKKKYKVPGSSSSSSVGYHHQSMDRISYRCHSSKVRRGENNVECKCTCGVGSTRTQKYYPVKENIHYGRKKSVPSHAYVNGNTNLRRHSYHQLKLLDEDYETLAVPSKLNNRSAGNWSVSMYGLSATQV